MGAARGIDRLRSVDQGSMSPQIPITLSWLNIICLLGAAQGVLLAGVLVTQRANRSANRLLAALMLTFSVYLVSSVYYAAGWIAPFPHFFGVAYPLPLVFGPLVYLYAVQASNRNRRFGFRDLLHFVPIATVVLATLPIYLKTGPEKIELYHQLQQGHVPRLLVVIDSLKYVSGVSYTAVTLLHLRRHRATVMNSYSTLERVNLRWLWRLAGTGATIWAVATILELSTLLHLSLQPASGLVALGIAITVYGIGYMGLRQPEIFNFVTASDPSPPAPPASPVLVSPAEQRARYERSGLGQPEAAALKDALLRTMERERPYQNSELTLADLAATLDTSAHTLSEVLSQQVGVTFYDFVNRYRVEDVQRRVADTRFRNLTLLALALDAGFASKSTFNNVFKKHTGQTPSEYRRALMA